REVDRDLNRTGGRGCRIIRDWAWSRYTGGERDGRLQRRRHPRVTEIGALLHHQVGVPRPDHDWDVDDKPLGGETSPARSSAVLIWYRREGSHLGRLKGPVSLVEFCLRVHMRLDSFRAVRKVASPINALTRG